MLTHAQRINRVIHPEMTLREALLAALREIPGRSACELSKCLYGLRLRPTPATVSGRLHQMVLSGDLRRYQFGAKDLGGKLLGTWRYWLRDEAPEEPPSTVTKTLSKLVYMTVRIGHQPHIVWLPAVQMTQGPQGDATFMTTDGREWHVLAGDWTTDRARAVRNAKAYIEQQVERAKELLPKSASIICSTKPYFLTYEQWRTR